MASFLHFGARHYNGGRLVVMAAGSALFGSYRRQNDLSRCEQASRRNEDAVAAGKLAEAPTVPVTLPPKVTKMPKVAGMQPHETGNYFEMFPKRQLWQPKLEYPLWDNDWDGKSPPMTGDEEADRKKQRIIRRNGVTRHIILVRHGQYDETHKEDEKRPLTPLGREQANLTGERLAKIIQGAEGKFGPCNVKVLTVSNLTRAKETADIIAVHLPNVKRAEPNPNLNEGRPCHYIPGTKANEKIVKTTDEGHGRIEKAFEEYFYRDDRCKGDKEVIVVESADDPATEVPGEKHEFEVIVCHANVIRYFLMRALQLPPEAWLRYCPFNCSLTYITIRPTGTVSCRMFGDIGHIPYEKSTFSSHEGFNW